MKWMTEAEEKEQKVGGRKHCESCQHAERIEVHLFDGVVEKRIESRLTDILMVRCWALRCQQTATTAIIKAAK